MSSKVTQKALEKTERAAAQLKIEQLQEETAASGKSDDDEEDDEEEDDGEEDKRKVDEEDDEGDEEDDEETPSKKKRERSASPMSPDGMLLPHKSLDKSPVKSLDKKATIGIF